MSFKKYNGENLDDMKDYILYFGAESCPGCKVLMSRIKNSFDDIDIIYVDVYNNTALQIKYSVISIPLLFVVRNNKVVETFNLYTFDEKKFLKSIGGNK